MMIPSIIKLAACICSQDGIISSEEVEYMKKKINSFDSNFDVEKVDDLIEEFFNEAKDISDYCKLLSKDYDTKNILDFCFKSASADGLDPKENTAYLKAKEYLSMD